MSMSTALSLLLYHAPICVTFFSVLFSFRALNLCIFPQFMFSHSVLYDLSLIWSLSFLDLCLSSLTLFVSALLEKQSKFPRYNMKCRGKRDTTWNIPRNITFSPLHFMLYHGELISFGTVYSVSLSLSLLVLSHSLTLSRSCFSSASKVFTMYLFIFFLNFWSQKIFESNLLNNSIVSASAYS